MRTFPVGAAQLFAIALVGFIATACGPKRGSQFVRENDPAVKIPAIRLAAHEQKSEVIPQLVTDLASEDPAVRFYAIEALQRLTGQTLDYVYYAPEDERREAIKRWGAWQEKNAANPKQ